MQDLRPFKMAMEEKIKKANNVFIVPHVGVDIDAISSAIGIAIIAKHLGKEPYVVINDVKLERGVSAIIDECKDSFNFINKEEYINISNNDDLFILTDVNKKSNICLNEFIINENKVIVIDHHKEDMNTVNSSLKCISTDASSASEIVTKLLHLFKIKLEPKIANDLLAGIYLDTNKLTKNIGTDTYGMLAKLSAMGADIKVVIKFFAEDFTSDRKVHALINRMEKINDCIALVLAQEGIEYTKEELAKVADYLLIYDGVVASFAVGKTDSNVVSISARSKDVIDVEEIMGKLDGGGNQYSAATRLNDCTVEEAGKKLVKLLPNL